MALPVVAWNFTPDAADRRGETGALHWLGRNALRNVDLATARTRLEEALLSFRSFEMWEEMFGCLEDLSELAQREGHADTAIRLAAAMLLGGIIGWEREVHSRAAGLRTHMMISLAAAVFAILAMELVHFEAVPGQQMRVDPLRLIEAVTSGVAFLAAGSIVVSGVSVRGITTGASMWLCGAIGLACGMGDLSLALLTTALAMTVLWLIHRLISPMAHKLKKPQPPPSAPPGDS